MSVTVAKWSGRKDYLFQLVEMVLHETSRSLRLAPRDGLRGIHIGMIGFQRIERVLPFLVCTKRVGRSSPQGQQIGLMACEAMTLTSHKSPRICLIDYQSEIAVGLQRERQAMTER